MVKGILNRVHQSVQCTWIIMMDQERQFVLTVCNDMCCNHWKTIAYHSKCNRKVEKFHCSIKEALQVHSFHVERNWIKVLPSIMLGLIRWIRTVSSSQIVYMYIYRDETHCGYYTRAIRKEFTRRISLYNSSMAGPRINHKSSIDRLKKVCIRSDPPRYLGGE